MAIYVFSVIVSLFGIWCIPQAVTCITSEQKERIDDFIENTFLVENRIPGLTLSIVENDQITVSKGYGYRNLSLRAPADDKTLMAIGSNSKSLLGTLVVKVLHEKFPELGVKALDTPLVKLLPPATNITFSDRYRAESMTFRDLLSHRSCLISEDMDLIFDTVSTIEEKKYRTRYEPEVCSFRNGYVYNNALYGLGGELIAEIAGVSSYTKLLVDFMQEIGMKSASILDKDGRFEELEDMSVAYYVKDGAPQVFSPKLLRRLHSALAAGGIIASPTDMANYLRFHMNLGRVGERQVIPENVMLRIYTISNSASASLFGKISSESDPVNGNLGYSLGFIVGLYDGWEFIAHGGYLPPFASVMFSFPKKNIGIFIASNGPGIIGGKNDLPLEYLVIFIFDILRGKVATSKKNLRPNFKTAHEFDLSILPSIELELQNGLRHRGRELDDLIGLYGHAVHGDLFVLYDESDDSNQTLKMKYGEYGVGRLLPQEQDFIYTVEFTTDILHHFYTYDADFLAELDLRFEKLAIIAFTGVPVLKFVKDADLGSFPPIPWSPESCGPSNEHSR